MSFKRTALLFLVAGCQSQAELPRLDEQTSSLLAQYDTPGTLTGFCRWVSATITPVSGVEGRLLLADEHSPDQFSPIDRQALPLEARYGAAIAFNKRDNDLRGRAFAVEGNVRVTGHVVVGTLACKGNSAYNPGADQSFDAALLVDEVVPAG